MLVSVIIPYFNDELNINKSVLSALNQTYKNIEIIIIDDENTKNSIDVLKKFIKEKRIKIIRNKKNLGVAFARNKGIKISKGQLVAFLDSDDHWNKKNINKKIKKIINIKLGSIKEKRLLKATDEKDNSRRINIT